MKEEIKYEDFAKLDIRVGTVSSAEAVEESNKLIKLEVDLGEDPSAGSGQARITRQLLAGLKETHDASALVGKKIIVLVNLEPRKMMGIESQGMLLAAATDEGPVLLVPDSDAPAGASVS